MKALALRIVIAVLMVSLSGCTSPDSGDWAKLVAAVGGLSEEARLKIVRYAMNRRAIEFLRDYDMDRRIGHITCDREDGSRFEAMEYKVEEAYICLMVPTSTWVECTSVMMEQLARKFEQMPEAKEKWGDFVRCEHWVSPFFGDLVDDELLTPEAWDNDEIARSVIGFPEPKASTDPLLAAAIAELIVTIRILAPALCVLADDHWSCPDAPLPDQGDR
jgi:hypothetical protein